MKETDRIAQLPHVDVERVPQTDDTRTFPFSVASDAQDNVILTATMDVPLLPPNLKRVENFGEKNRSVQVQIGDALTSWIRQEEGSRHSHAETIQIGVNLFAEIVQSGELHRARVRQLGGDLSATVVQENLGNEAALFQRGLSLSATIHQAGAFAKVFVSQVGEGDHLVLTQR